MDYKTVNLKKVSLSTLNVAELREKIKQVDAQNQALYNGAVLDWRDLLKKAADIYGAGSKVHTYLKKNRPPEPPSHTKDWNKLMRQFADWQRSERTRAAAREYRVRRRSAVEELEAHGYIEGEHYPNGRAISFKKKMLYQRPDGSYAPRYLPDGTPVIG